MDMSPRAVQMQGTEALTKIVKHVEAHPNVHAIECLFLSDTDGSGALDSEEFAGAVQHMGLDMPVEQTDLAFAVLCLEGKDEINIEQFISFQQQYRRAREQEAYSSSAESLVARSLLSLPTNERLTVIEEMGQKAWDQALTKMENTAYDSTDADDDAELTLQWSLVTDGPPLAQITTTKLNAINLVVRPNALAPGASYSFQLKADYQVTHLLPVPFPERALR